MAGRSARGAGRARLLDAADDLFYARGIAATGVDAVLRRAGASPTTLYAHFPGKDALVAGYLERRYRRWREVWDDALARADDPAGRLLSVFDALAAFRRDTGSTRGCAVLAAAAELPDPAHPARRWIEADTALLDGRLRELADAAGATEPARLVAELRIVYDGLLAAYARAVPDPLPAARDLAGAAVRRHLPEPTAGPRGVARSPG